MHRTEKHIKEGSVHQQKDHNQYRKEFEIVAWECRPEKQQANDDGKGSNEVQEWSFHAALVLKTGQHYNVPGEIDHESGSARSLSRNPG